MAASFDVSESALRRWMARADGDEGITDGLTTAEQDELVQLRRRARRLEQENEILRPPPPTSPRTTSQDEVPVGP